MKKLLYPPMAAGPFDDAGKEALALSAEAIDRGDMRSTNGMPSDTHEQPFTDSDPRKDGTHGMSALRSLACMLFNQAGISKPQQPIN